MGYSCSNCQSNDDQNIIEIAKKQYYYKVGNRKLHIKYGEALKNITGAGLAHHCLLYDDEIFELLKDGYHRRKFDECNDFNEYSWSPIYQGYSTKSPDELDNFIKDKVDKEYNAIKNNCQHFVDICLLFLDYKKGIKYNNEEMCCGHCIGLNIKAADKLIADFYGRRYLIPFHNIY